jgi:hypothetical protein
LKKKRQEIGQLMFDLIEFGFTFEAQSNGTLDEFSSI